VPESSNLTNSVRSDKRFNAKINGQTRVLSQCDPVANGVDTSLLEHVSPIEWDNVVLYGQYILDRKLVRRRPRSMKVALSV
jgi:hypothetical protein